MPAVAAARAIAFAPDASSNALPGRNPMIHHVSIPAHDPAHVAGVLAEVMKGRAYGFPGAVPGAFMAVSGDARGTLIEVYPRSTVGRPGADDQPVDVAHNPAPPEYWPFHVLLAVKSDEAEILRIGEREGWRTRRFGRGAPGQKPFFEVIEFWVENSVMFELAPEGMIGPYERLFQFDTLEAAMAAMAPGGQ